MTTDSHADDATFSARLLDPCDARPRQQAELRDWLQLQAALGLRPQLARESLALRADPAAALRISGVRPRFDRSQLEAAVASLRRAGACAVPLGCPDYPAALLALSDPPPLLLVRGQVACLSQLCVAIVGARAATAYGLGVARELVARLAGAGAVVVSGLARGIDAAAHEAALEAGGRTIAVQACGPERTYPAAHRKLAERICERGAVVTELSPGTHPQPAFFPLRNRLISGLSRLVVVVEARARSGSLITARHALDQGRDVMALPGPITAPTSAGPNALLRDGAAPVLGADQLLDALGLCAPPRRSPRRNSGAPAPGPVLEALRHQPRSRDELSRDLGLPPEQLQLELLELELEGRIAQSRDGRWMPAPEAAE